MQLEAVVLFVLGAMSTIGCVGIMLIFSFELWKPKANQNMSCPKTVLAFYGCWLLWFALAYTFFEPLHANFHYVEISFGDITRKTTAILEKGRKRLADVVEYKLTDKGTFNFEDTVSEFKVNTGFSDIESNNEIFQHVLSKAEQDIDEYRHWVQAQNSSFSKECGLTQIDFLLECAKNVSNGHQELLLLKQQTDSCFSSLNQRLINEVDKLQKKTILDSSIGKDLKRREKMLMHFETDVDNTENRKKELVEYVISLGPDEVTIYTVFGRSVAIIFALLSIAIMNWSGRGDCGIPNSFLFGIGATIYIAGIICILINAFTVTVALQWIHPKCPLMSNFNLANFTSTFDDFRVKPVKICDSQSSTFYSSSMLENSTSSERIAKSLNFMEYTNDLTAVVNGTVAEIRLPEVLTNGLDKMTKGLEQMRVLNKKGCLTKDVEKDLAEHILQFDKLVLASKNYINTIQVYNKQLKEGVAFPDIDKSYSQVVHDLRRSTETFRDFVKTTDFDCGDLFEEYSEAGGRICTMARIPMIQYIWLFIVANITPLLYVILFKIMYHQLKAKIDEEEQARRSREAFLQNAKEEREARNRQI